MEPYKGDELEFRENPMHATAVFKECRLYEGDPGETKERPSSEGYTPTVIISLY